MIELTLRLLGSLALLIYGMKTMSDSLQKMAGPSLRHILGRMTDNRLSGILTGTMVTCAVQSSSATTVMTVSFVSAGLLSLSQAISVIMGANIGTTLTAWIMSLGYNVDLTIVVFSAFLTGMLLIYKKRNRVAGEFIFGLAFLFWSLIMLSSVGKDLCFVRYRQLSHYPYISRCWNRAYMRSSIVCSSNGNHYPTLFHWRVTYLHGYRSGYGREHRHNSYS